MKRVLITGAAGFLGSHLCERFLNENFFCNWYGSISLQALQKIFTCLKPIITSNLLNMMYQNMFKLMGI